MFNPWTLTEGKFMLSKFLFIRQAEYFLVFTVFDFLEMLCKNLL